MKNLRLILKKSIITAIIKWTETFVEIAIKKKLKAAGMPSRFTKYEFNLRRPDLNKQDLRL